MAAAVSDYRPTQVEIRKIKRAHEEMTFHLTANPDILKQVASLPHRQIVVGFAAETHDLEAEARRKMREKHLDLIVANDVNRPDSGFQVDTNEVTLIPRVGEAMPLPLLSKEEVAAKILDQVVAASGNPRRGPCQRCLKTRLRNCGNWSIVYLIGSAISGAWDGGGCRARSRPRFRKRDKSADKILSLEEIRAEMGDCRRCKLYGGRSRLVFGDGAANARLMFVGEAPGADEDKQGVPFVGAAGNLLNNLLSKLGLRREEVYIANILKSRPPGNRDPEADEIAACLPFLEKQIKAIRPRVIVTLGRISYPRPAGHQGAPDPAAGTVATVPRHPGDAHVSPVLLAEGAPGAAQDLGRHAAGHGVSDWP